MVVTEIICDADEDACDGATINILNAGHGLKIICKGVEACEGTTFDITIAEDDCGYGKPITKLGGIICKGERACAEGTTFRIRKASGKPVNVGTLLCKGQDACDDTLNIELLGRVFIEDCECSKCKQKYASSCGDFDPS